jgi:hypothetical protein
MKHQRFIKDDPAGRFTNKDAGLAICACAISTLSDYRRAFREIDLALGLLTAAAPNFFQFASDRRGHPPSACRRRRGSDFRQRIAVRKTSTPTSGRLLAFLGRQAIGNVAVGSRTVISLPATFSGGAALRSVPLRFAASLVSLADQRQNTLLDRSLEFS